MGKIFYLGEIFNGLDKLSTFILVFSLAATLISFIAFVSTKSNGYEKGDPEFDVPKNICKKAIIIAFIAFIVNTFIPSRTTWYLMVGGNAIEQVAKSQQVSETAEKTFLLINQYLDQKLEEGKPTANDENK